MRACWRGTSNAVGSNVGRSTIQRQAILSSVPELNIHATAEQVYGHIVKQYPAISKATVYRNLAQMAEAGLLQNIGSYYGAAHYDHNLHAHYHFICERCRRVFDVEGYSPALPARLEGLEGFEVTGHRLSFSGLCKECKVDDAP